MRLRLGETMKNVGLIEECAAFNGDDGVKDDAVDALTIAVSVWSYKGGGYDVKAS